MKKNNLSKIAAGIAALTMAASMFSVNVFADDTTTGGNGTTGTADASANDTATSNVENVDLSVVPSAHTYTYYQIFTGDWFEDSATKKYVLTDADFGADINKETLIADIVANYKDDLNKVYLKNAIAAKIVDEGATIEDVEAKIKAEFGEAGWAKSEYNIAGFNKDNPVTQRVTQDMLELFKYWQNTYTSYAEEDTHIAGYNPKTGKPENYPYTDAIDRSKSVTEGNKKIIDLLSRNLLTGEGHGTEIKANYNEKVTKSVPKGYYLIFEDDNGWTDDGRHKDPSDPDYKPEDHALRAVIMKIVDGKIDITPKIGTPVVEKKILENNQDVTSVGDDLFGAYQDFSDEDFTAKVKELIAQNPDAKWVKDITRWNDAADYSIGDQVPFVVYGSVSENIADYSAYYYCFHDSLAKGFTLGGTSATDTTTLDKSVIKVMIGKTDPVQKPSDSDNAANSRKFVGVDVTDKAEINVKKNADGSTAIDISFKNLKALGVDIDKDTTVRVTYTATLNYDAIIGRKGNTNGVYLSYSNDTKYNGEGTPTEENTPWDGVTAFTYMVHVNKVDKDTKDPLANAVFALKATSGDHEGQYAVVYPNAEAAEGATTDPTATTTGYYGKVVKWVKPTVDADGKEEVPEEAWLITTSGGVVEIKGLDDGTYELTELEAPKGYHKLREPVPITIDAKLNNNGTYTYIKDDGSAAFLDLKKGESLLEAAAYFDETKKAKIEVPEGTKPEDVDTRDSENQEMAYTTDIGNTHGINLPETGGVGTVLLYTIGGLASVAGGTYFVTRKKRKNEE